MISKPRLASGLVWRLYAGYALLILVTLLLAGVPAARRIRNDSLEEIRQSLHRQALLIEEVASPELILLAGGEPPEAGASRADRLQERILHLGRALETRLTLIAPDGRVLADSAGDPARIEPHSDRPEIVEAARTLRAAHSVRTSSTTGIRMMYLAWPVVRGNELHGFVRTSRSLASIEDRLAQIRGAFFLGGALAAAVALALGYYLARQVSLPLRSMTRVAEAIAAGDHEQRVRSRSSDEVGRLARAFDTMAQELGRRLETITTERNRMQAVLRGMVEGVVAIDRDERVVHMNRAAERILRARRAARKEPKIWEVTRIAPVHEVLGRAVSTGQRVREVLHLEDGTNEQHIELEASPLSDGRGEVAGAVLVLHDVTELRALENVRRDFVANVSHELKTPLTAIRGMIETVLDDPGMEAQVRDRFLARMHEQSQRLSALVVDLLALSRLESEREPELEAIDLRTLVRECGREQQGAAEASTIQLELELPSEAVHVLGSAEDLRQMVGNLVDNAIKYTPAGGRVGVRLRPRDGHALLEVWDTGIGIEPRDQERIFERFYRVDKARSRELGGTGLGLSIVKHVVLKHRGELSVESQPGAGTTFRVDLPLVSSRTIGD